MPTKYPNKPGSEPPTTIWETDPNLGHVKRRFKVVAVLLRAGWDVSEIMEVHNALFTAEMAEKGGLITAELRARRGAKAATRTSPWPTKTTPSAEGMGGAGVTPAETAVRAAIIDLILEAFEREAARRGAVLTGDTGKAAQELANETVPQFIEIIEYSTAGHRR